MNPTERRRLGRTDVELTQFGFGSASLGELFQLVSEEDARATIQALWNEGIRYFDSAPLYGWGLSEHRIGSFLAQKPRDEFVLSTKIGRVLKSPKDRATFKAPLFLGGLPFDHYFDYSYDGVMRSYEDSLQRLRLNRIDLLIVHDLEPAHHGEELPFHREQFEKGGWRALEELRASGDIRAIGAGINELGVIPFFVERYDLDFFMLARHYSLLEQEAAEEELPLCAEWGMGIVLASVFNSGILVTGPVQGAKLACQDASEEALERAGRIQTICGRHGVSLPTAAIQFPLAHSCVASVLTGMLHPEQVRANLGSFREEVPPALWEELKAEGLLREEAPVPSGR